MNAMNHQDSIPKVCVALPVLNGEKDFEGALVSIIEQDYEDLDILICDNGSTDKTPEIYNKYAAQDKRIRISWADNLDRPTRSFNRGFYWNLGRSPYFMWAASDDRRDPSFISKCVDVLDNDPNVALVYSYTRFIDDDGNTIGHHQDPFDLTKDTPAERYVELVGRLGYCNCFYGLYRSDMLALTSVFDNIRSGIDALMLTELLFHGKIVQIPEPLFYRNMHLAFIEPGERQQNPTKLSEKGFYPPGTGICCPYLDYVLQYFEIVRLAPISPEEKPKLFQTTRERITQGAHFNKIKPEIDRVIQLVLQNKFYEEWNTCRYEINVTPEWNSYARPYYLTQLIHILDNCLFLYPNYSGLQTARAVCLFYMGRAEEAKKVLEIELKKNPQMQVAQELLQKLSNML